MNLALSPASDAEIYLLSINHMLMQDFFLTETDSKASCDIN